MVVTPLRNVLISYIHFKGFDVGTLPTDVNIIGDSGAYTAHVRGDTITPGQLAQWAIQWRHRLLWVASLDVIGDQAATRRNWHEMVDVHGVQAVPTIHYGTAPEQMDYYAARGVDFIGLGGLVGRPIPSQMRWLVHVLRYAREVNPHVRFHGWGIMGKKHMKLPLFSVDSSGWAGALVYGHFTIRDPQSNSDYVVKTNGRDAYAPRIAALLKDQYGVTPSSVSCTNLDTRADVMRVAMASAHVHAQRFRTLHRASVTPPSWGINGSPGNGPLCFMALASGDMGTYRKIL